MVAPCQARILIAVIGGEVRTARAHMIEQDSPEFAFECGGYEPPHVLVATEAVSEQHGPLAGAADLYVIAFEDLRHR
jgi:hypothetical protein